MAGEQAAEVVRRRLQSHGAMFTGRELGRLTVGRFGPGPGEPVVVVRRADGAVELHCHGGQAAVGRIVALLAEDGCVAADWRDWAGEQASDPIAADAWVALAEARTARTARILADQYGGALRQAVNALREALGRRDVENAVRQLDALLDRAQLGRHLVEPWHVVLAGAPNVGKSSLMNALLGYGRAIVHPTPGTTRDVVTAITAVDGWPVELADTAGLRAAEESVEQAGVALAEQRLAGAEIVVLMFDASRRWSPVDEHLARQWPAAIRVHHKSDLPRPADDARPLGVAASALTGLGIEAVLEAIAARIVPAPIPAQVAVPFTNSQVSQLGAMRAEIERGDVAAAEALVLRFGWHDLVQAPSL